MARLLHLLVGVHRVLIWQLAAAIAASLQAPVNSAGATTAPPAPASEVEANYEQPPEEPTPGAPGATVLRIRLPNGSQMQRTFSADHTLHEVLCTVHHVSMKLKANKVRLNRNRGVN